MNQRIDFSNLGGFPATQYMTDYMQVSYRGAFAALASLIGDKVIISGCQIVGDQITNGWISVAGELVPFVGGTGDATSQIKIIETNETRLFFDNTSKAVYFKRQAQITSPGSFLYSDLKNIGAIRDIIPTGLISMWSGAIANIPNGWALCDGTNGTPNLSGKFIVGYSAADGDYNAIGKTGGSKTVTLIKNNLPNVPIDVPIPKAQTSQTDVGYGNIVTGNTGNEPVDATTLQTSPLGISQPFDTRPPYYTLAYIIKL